MNICVLVRVYNRLADLAVCLEAIRTHWRLHRYHVVVLSNGRRDGYPLPAHLGSPVAVAVECDAGLGHVAGNSRLLLEGVRHIPGDCDYTVLLEADTWVHTDSVLDRYLGRMKTTGAVWASAEWVEKFQSLAVDFALVRSSFVRDHPDVFEFPAHAEYHVAKHLADRRVPFLHMREHMPVHVPRAMRMFYAGRADDSAVFLPAPWSRTTSRISPAVSQRRSGSRTRRWDGWSTPWLATSGFAASTANSSGCSALRASRQDPRGFGRNASPRPRGCATLGDDGIIPAASVLTEASRQALGTARRSLRRTMARQINSGQQLPAAIDQQDAFSNTSGTAMTMVSSGQRGAFIATSPGNGAVMEDNTRDYIRAARMARGCTGSGADDHG